jgi:predicted nuclease with TOPRIM domain
MEAMRQSWTDDRMDDLSRRMDERFDHVDERFRQVDERFRQVDERFRRVDERFDKVDRRFDRVEDDIKSLGVEMNMRFDSLQRMLFLGMCGLLGAVAAALVGSLAA